MINRRMAMAGLTRRPGSRGQSYPSRCLYRISSTPETVPQAQVDPSLFTDGVEFDFFPDHDSGSTAHAANEIMLNAGADNSQSRFILKKDTTTQDSVVYRSATSGNLGGASFSYSNGDKITIRGEHQNQVLVFVNGVLTDTIDISSATDSWTAGDLHVGEGASSLLPVSGAMGLCGRPL